MPIRDPRTPARRPPARRGGGAALRTEIIDAASRELARTGDVGMVSLRSVARNVGVAATSIYLHFASLDDLVDAVKQARFKEFEVALQSAADAAGDDPVARVSARARAYIDFGLAKRGEYVILFTARLRAEAPEPAQELAGQNTLRALVQDVTDALSAVRGRPVSVTEGNLITLHLWTSMHGLVLLRIARPEFSWPSLEMQRESLITTVLSIGMRVPAQDSDLR